MKLPYTVRGKVKKGAERGRDLGFPTANIALHKKLPEGIYASEVTVDGNPYPAAIFIGSAKTFNEKDYKLEAYILDFDKDLYGKWITVHLLKKLRENKEFKTPEDLVKQMEKDVLEVRAFLSSR